MMKKIAFFLLVVISAVALLCACGADIDNTHIAAAGQQASYRQISSDEAKGLMETERGYIILDVRTQEEYDAGHIPGAICVPNESIDTTQPPELPDKDQVILVYCRSGRRSKEASQKLAEMGYTNIVEFGGIIDWSGEIVTEE